MVAATNQPSSLVAALENLTGQAIPLLSDFATALECAEVLLSSEGSGLGYSQFNELLLLAGYDRVTPSFFQFLVDDTLDYRVGAGIASLEQFLVGIQRFRKIALLSFGNVKFAFKRLSGNSEQLRVLISNLKPIDETWYTARHQPIQPVEPIAGEDTFYLGHIVQREIDSRVRQSPDDPVAISEQKKYESLKALGEKNLKSYLASDHLDVYVATSMRERHEYLLVNQYVNQIFEQGKLRSLKLRWFDPTQAYCVERIDKGLAEALMLKRAQCTLYFVQEADTFGKDSELASTLAQGKPVIAFVPDVDAEFLDNFLAKLKAVYPGKEERDLLLEQLRLFEPGAAWKDKNVRKWLDVSGHLDASEVKARLHQRIKARYDERAATLREYHPLGIQVNLGTGVANGVLVVRRVEECAELIWRVLVRRLEFDLEPQSKEGRTYLLLREKVSGSVFRVMTGDPMLTNAFWNFYLTPAGKV